MLRTRAALVVGLGSAVLLSACSSSSSSSGGGGGSSSGGSLVLDNAFDLKTADPARSFELTGALLTKQLYETALTFDGSDVKKPVPQVTTYEMSPDAKTVTLKLTGTHTFADGSAVSADDIVFSYQRVQGIKGNPSFLLDGVTVAKVDDSTVSLTSADPNPSLPYILPNPSLGIVESKLVKQNGGTTDESDKAEDFLNKQSAGSAPYQLDTVDVTSSVTLKRNDKYAGTAPKYARIVLNNVQPATQKVDAQSGNAQIVTDLSADQAKGLESGSTQVISGTSAYLIFSWFNTDPKYGGPAADPSFVRAVRHALDYKTLGQLAGSGSTQPGGVVPSVFLGALKDDPANTYDPEQAKTLLAASGYRGEPVQYLFSNDVAISGVQLQVLAQSVQSQLKAVGINLTLAPKPSATSLDSFRSGTFQAGLAYWGPDFPDPSDYLPFTPGQSVAKRAAWQPTSTGAAEVMPLVEAAKVATGDAARTAAYQALQKQMNATGPFVPLVQPGQNVVAASGLKGIDLNPVWTLDLARVS